MNRSLIANRYAKALFKLALEQGNLDKINSDVKLLQSYCNEADGFLDLLMSPIIKPGQKKHAIHSVLDKKISVSTMNFLDLLIQNNREVLIEDINRGYESLYKNHLGVKDVTLYTAIKMDKEQLQALDDFLKQQFNAPIELTLKVNPDLLGGFKITIDGKLADASLSSKLKKMKKQLLS
ncbi:ATP synthase F1 subunit delta [Carboxylicivirga sp. N1Y90]|uniref:ATP synthase F1 subunit delta n=1 Tax=Carboxylicivirga fragile TaxID=3417571 RepID=UPI003D3409DC|nr:ATP synthase F1 subunit delta [Marinilabiliaceae bacterium N1Y90]